VDLEKHSFFAGTIKQHSAKYKSSDHNLKQYFLQSITDITYSINSLLQKWREFCQHCSSQWNAMSILPTAHT